MASCAELTEPSRVMAPTSPMRSRLMRSPATTGVQSLHDRRAEARSPADLCVPFLHNAVESFNRPLRFNTRAHVLSVKKPSGSSCGHGVVEQRYTQNSEWAFVLLKVFRHILANCVCNKPRVLGSALFCSSRTYN